MGAALEEREETNDQPEGQDEETYLTMPEMVKLTDKCANTIRTWIYKGLLPARKVGKYGRYTVRKSDFDKLLEFRTHGK